MPMGHPCGLGLFSPRDAFPNREDNSRRRMFSRTRLLIYVLRIVRRVEARRPKFAIAHPQVQ